VEERVDVSAKIEVEYKKEENFIYQIIRIVPNKPGNIRYFTHPRYRVGRAIEDLLQDIYIGDGENIFFVSEDRFKNVFTIKYRIDNDNYFFHFKDRSYVVEGTKPKYDGCLSCDHLRKVKQGKDYCSLYKKFLDKYKKSCVDFLEKD